MCKTRNSTTENTAPFHSSRLLTSFDIIFVHDYLTTQ